jgi:hypothetical protein
VQQGKITSKLSYVGNLMLLDIPSFVRILGKGRTGTFQDQSSRSDELSRLEDWWNRRINQVIHKVLYLSSFHYGTKSWSDFVARKSPWLLLMREWNCISKTVTSYPDFGFLKHWRSAIWGAQSSSFLSSPVRYRQYYSLPALITFVAFPVSTVRRFSRCGEWV